MPVDGPKATPMMLPSMIPKAVHLVTCCQLYLDTWPSVVVYLHLPLHDQRTADWRRRAFCSVDWDSGRLWANAKAQEKASQKEINPRIGDPFPDRRHGRNEARYEYGPATAKDPVERFRQPATNDGAAEVRCADDEPGDAVLHALAEARDIGPRDVEVHEIQRLGAVVDRLVHSLHAAAREHMTQSQYSMNG